MKQDASFFEDRDAVLVYIAKKLKDALRLEALFTDAGIDYGVETDEYHGGVVFPRRASERSFTYFPMLKRRPARPWKAPDLNRTRNSRQDGSYQSGRSVRPTPSVRPSLRASSGDSIMRNSASKSAVTSTTVASCRSKVVTRTLVVLPISPARM